MNVSSQPPPATVSERKTRWLIFAGVFVVAMAFAAFTHHAWEDYYITYRVSKNLATGHGLVYNVGERVHAFTSPINVLLPAALSAITANTSDSLVLWLFRVLSAAVLGCAAVLLFGIARNNSFSRLAMAVLLGMFAFDAKIVDFSINGQEIAFMMFFLALALHALTVRSDWPTLKLGLAGGGLMWTRPDGFIYLSAIALGFLLFNAARPIGLSRRGLFKMLLRAAVITTVLYLPWLVWTWHYFGSPVPHTIVAKALTREAARVSSHPWLLSLLAAPIGMLRTSAGATFLPAYALVFGGWHWTVGLYGKLLACFCIFYWCLPFARPQARAVSFALMLGHFYLSYAASFPFPWYVPNCTILGIVVLGYATQQGLDWVGSLRDWNERASRHLRALTRISATAVLSGAFLLLVCTAWQLRIQQRVIEDGMRKQIGLWLREHASSPSDTVFLEPLGYIGYFSQLKMLDTPGLCSAEVVAAEKRLKTTSLDKVIPVVHPDWLVLRPEEIDKIEKANSRVLTEAYSVAKVFDASARIASYRWLPGRGYLLFDQKFVVYRRRQPEPHAFASSVRCAQIFSKALMY